MLLKRITKITSVISCLVLTNVNPVSAKEDLSLKYQNNGVNFYTTNEIYSPIWQKSLNYALKKYQEILFQPSAIDVYLVESKKQAQKLRQENSQKRTLVLSLETIASKKHDFSTEYAILNHELCHLWLIDSVKKQGLVSTPDPMGLPTYGHANLNDWIDESVATQCELGEIEQSRVDNTFSITPLEQFLVQQNPAFALMKEQIMAALKNSNGNQIVITKEVDDAVMTAFYQQSTWLRKFLLHKLGNGIYQQMVQQLIEGNDVNQYLLNALGYSGWQEVDKAFKDFIVKSKSK